MLGRDMDRQQFDEKRSVNCVRVLVPRQRLLQHVFPKTLTPKKFFCPDKEKNYNPCTLRSCKEFINGILMDNGEDAKDACPKMCSSVAVAMLGRDMDRRRFDEKKITELCPSIDSTSETSTRNPTTAAAICPNAKFSSCKDLCEYALSETLHDDPRLCWDGKTSATFCIHNACEIVVHQTLMLEHVCPEMCPSMIAAVREVEGRHPRSKSVILELCLNVSSTPTIFPSCPVTTSVEPGLTQLW
ncbi:hypothetical protein RB195_016715 [Necator americanus]|uniref:Chondroitin proteoglycan 4 domain-containing protein n=1 Tax=Necator americanus TaxID=51031 RepID=A0ABR1C5H7_NECAM